MKQSASGKHRRARSTRWVLGAVEREGKAIKMEVVCNRSGATISAFTRRHVLRGTAAKTDGWKGYNSLTSLTSGGTADTFEVDGAHSGANITPRSESVPMNISREIVNHNLEFVTPTGVHINSIENAWSTFKRRFSARYGSTADIQPFLDEFCFRWTFCAGSLQDRGLCFRVLAEKSACYR